MLYRQRSFAVKVNITTASTNDERNSNVKAIRKEQVSIKKTKENQINSNKEFTTDVIYVFPRDAKATRIELEKLGYFNGQHKLVNVEKEIDGSMKVVIGLPITQQCKKYIIQGESALELESAMIGLGEETAPFSSSQMSKIGNIK